MNLPDVAGDNTPTGVFGSFNGRNNSGSLNGNMNGVLNTGDSVSGNQNGNRNTANLNGNFNGQENLGSGHNGNANGNENTATQPSDECKDIAAEEMTDFWQRKGRFAAGGELAHCRGSGNNNGNRNTGTGINGNWNGNRNTGDVENGSHNGNNQGGAGFNGNHNGQGNINTLPSGFRNSRARPESARKVKQSTSSKTKTQQQKPKPSNADDPPARGSLEPASVFDGSMLSFLNTDGMTKGSDVFTDDELFVLSDAFRAQLGQQKTSQRKPKNRNRAQQRNVSNRNRQQTGERQSLDQPEIVDPILTNTVWSKWTDWLK